jgi:sugar lactone lactonase YvrE
MITPSTTISSPSSSLSIDPVVMLTPKFFNDFDITSNGKIIFTDSSYRNGRSENRVEILDGAPTGRVLMYDMYKKELTTIVCGLHFSNGVQLILNDKNYKSDSDNDNNNNDDNDNNDDDNDSEEVIVNDLVRFRALRINISSPYLISGEALQSCDEYGNTYQGTIYQYLYILLIHH